MDMGLDKLPCGYLLLNDKGIILEANAFLYELLGFEPELLTGNKIETILSDASKLLFNFILIPGIEINGKAEEVFMIFCSKNGAEITLLTNTAARYVDDTRVLDCVLMPTKWRIEKEEEVINTKKELEDNQIALLNLVDDLNIKSAELESKNAELQKMQKSLFEMVDDLNNKTAELSIAKVRAESADRLKSAFLANMSHELRTPLNSIIGFSGILMQQRPGPLNPEQKKQLGMVQGSARHLLSLINDVLDLSKIEAGQFRVHFESFDMPEIIHKVVQSSKPFADKKNIRIEVSINCAPGMIKSDSLRVEQVLLNLVNNAIKFTERGSVRVECERDENEISVKITDTGIGIEKEKLGDLFKPFMQIDTGISRKHEGTGLGLSICKRLLDLLHGTIEVESEIGVGSTFTVRLPVE